MEAWSLYSQHREPNHRYSNPDHNAQLGYEHWNIRVVFFSKSWLEVGISSVFSLLFELVVDM